jgi:threonine aldolase
MKAAGKTARKYGLSIHVDGARIFNAAVALDQSAAALAADADSIGFCLSKGLCAPVGSVVCGSRSFVDRARRARKVLGGGMRQAGIIAAAGIVALTEMIDRLTEDHENARRFAEGIAEIQGFGIDPSKVRTNIVFIGTADTGKTAAEIVARLESLGVRCLASAPDTLRAVTHHPITDADIDKALAAFREAAK